MMVCEFRSHLRKAFCGNQLRSGIGRLAGAEIAGMQFRIEMAIESRHLCQPEATHLFHTPAAVVPRGVCTNLVFRRLRAHGRLVNRLKLSEIVELNLAGVQR